MDAPTQTSLFDDLKRGEYPIPDDAPPATCASCGKAIVWIRTPNDKAMPLSLSTARLVNGQRVAMNHWVDCPDRQEWRKR